MRQITTDQIRGNPSHPSDPCSSVFYCLRRTGGLMIVIFHGKGGSVILLPLSVIVLLELAGHFIWPGLEIRLWMAGLILVPSGVILRLWGKRLNGRLDRATEEQARAAGKDP